MVRRLRLVVVASLSLPVLALGALAVAEPYASLYDADYVGSERCAACHTLVAGEWRHSPHAFMARPASPASVVGDFDDHEWSIPGAAQKTPDDAKPVKCYRRGDEYFMALWHGDAKAYAEFRIDVVVGYQYRQTYLVREPGGVLRRLPLQWFPARGEFYPYWSYQEQKEPDLLDLWGQMRVHNSAWNLFCARCHTTHLEIHPKDQAHSRAETEWRELGIGCEACHGPGSHHVEYFEKSYPNRIAAFARSKFRGEPVAYIAAPQRLTKGQDMSICGRCHGADIAQDSQDIYRTFEPGHSREGRVNDLSPHFQEYPLQPGRTEFTVECWGDGRPKGIGTLFRSFVESRCYQAAEVRCYDCHNPHDNKQARAPGLLQASAQSDNYCLRCHPHLAADPAAHTHHRARQPGSFCYDCHLPKSIHNHVGGYLKETRTHDMSTIPKPAVSLELGLENAPNACNDCHADRDPAWAVARMREWWPPRSRPR